MPEWIYQWKDGDMTPSHNHFTQTQRGTLHEKDDEEFTQTQGGTLLLKDEERNPFTQTQGGTLLLKDEEDDATSGDGDMTPSPTQNATPADSCLVQSDGSHEPYDHLFRASQATQYASQISCESVSQSVTEPPIGDLRSEPSTPTRSDHCDPRWQLPRYGSTGAAPRTGAPKACPLMIG